MTQGNHENTTDPKAGHIVRADPGACGRYSGVFGSTCINCGRLEGVHAKPYEWWNAPAFQHGRCGAIIHVEQGQAKPYRCVTYQGGCGYIRGGWTPVKKDAKGRWTVPR